MIFHDFLSPLKINNSERGVNTLRLQFNHTGQLLSVNGFEKLKFLKYRISNSRKKISKVQNDTIRDYVSIHVFFAFNSRRDRLVYFHIKMLYLIRKYTFRWMFHKTVKSVKRGYENGIRFRHIFYADFDSFILCHKSSKYFFGKVLFCIFWHSQLYWISKKP